MSISVNVEDLIRTRRIEECRVVLHPRWDPTKVMHDICAFANDIEGYGCGYIVVGVAEHGNELEIIGIPDEELDAIENGFPQLYGAIVPYYIPRFSREVYSGKNVAVIVAEAGRSGTYSCPESASNTRKLCYVRRDGRTVRMKKATLEAVLLDCGYPPDMTPCWDASCSDIRSHLMLDYLHMTDNDLAKKNPVPNSISLARSMRLIYDAIEGPRPRMAAILMFNENPEWYYRYARIDIVLKPDPTGEGMEERSFRGPLFKQTLDALDYIRNNIVAERVYKHSDRPQATRVFNYPYEAVKEALVNAVCHKCYQIGEEITVTVTPDSMTIRNFSWCHSIPREGVLKGEIPPTPCINSLVRDMFQELGLTGRRGTGIPRIIEVMEHNGSAPPEFRLYKGEVHIWDTVLKLNPRFKTKNAVLDYEP